MSFESELYSYLTGQSALTDEVSTRIYPSMAPQNAVLPLIVYIKVTDEAEGHSTGASGMSLALYQFDIWAATNVSRITVSAALRGELDGFRGTLASSEWIHRCHMVNESDTAQLTQEGTEDQDFRTTQEYEIHYKRAVPTF